MRRAFINNRWVEDYSEEIDAVEAKIRADSYDMWLSTTELGNRVCIYSEKAGIPHELISLLLRRYGPRYYAAGMIHGESVGEACTGLFPDRQRLMELLDYLRSLEDFNDDRRRCKAEMAILLFNAGLFKQRGTGWLLK